MAQIKPSQIKVASKQESKSPVEKMQPKNYSSSRILGRLGLFVFVALLLLVILNASYFWKNIVFTFFHKPTVPTQQVQNPAPAMEPNTLIIESLNINVPVQYADQANETTFQAALINGVVHYPGTAMPGEFGNDYIFGHSSDFIFSKGHFKTAFALLPKIQNGAQVFLSGPSGQKFIYRVYNQFVTSPDDTSVLSQGDKTKQLLTLQTSYPVGTALKRYIVQAELISQ